LLIAQLWVDLAERGIGAVLPDAHHVVLSGPCPPTTWALHVSKRPLRPARLHELVEGVRRSAAGERLLVITAAASASTVQAAAVAGVSVLVAPSEVHRATTGVLILPGGQRLDLTSPDPTVRRLRPGRPAWATYAILTYLLDAPAPQGELAKRAGVSQARVSQVLSGAREWVSNTGSLWRVSDWDGLARWIGATAPSAGDLASTWLGLDSPTVLGASIAKTLGERGVRYALSGDVAGDYLAPWAHPTRAVIYTERGFDLGELGLTPAPADQANLEVLIPVDPYVLRDTTSAPGSPVLASPWRVWLDARRVGNLDAASAVLDFLRDRARVAR